MPDPQIGLSGQSEFSIFTYPQDPGIESHSDRYPKLCSRKASSRYIWATKPHEIYFLLEFDQTFLQKRVCHTDQNVCVFADGGSQDLNLEDHCFVGIGRAYQRLLFAGRQPP